MASFDPIAACGWPKLYYGVFSDAIRSNDFKRCVKVGIGYGMHAREILDNTYVERLFLVDLMRPYADDGFAGDVIKGGGFEANVRRIRELLRPHEDRYTWFRVGSQEVTNDMIADGTMDAVFLDGDHTYEAVRGDLPFWWNKLRSGGWLLGDDYRSSHAGVTRAVDEFVRSNGLHLELLFKPGTRYPIYKIAKP